MSKSVNCINVVHYKNSNPAVIGMNVYIPKIFDLEFSVFPIHTLLTVLKFVFCVSVLRVYISS